MPKPDAVLLRLQLIGRMQAVTLNNESVLPLGRKTRGLLAILAMSGRRPVLRSRLAELLWSRRSDEQARASLRQEIHRLLEALSPVGADIITVERHTLALKPALTSVDAERILNASPNQADSLPPIEGVLLEELSGTDPALDVWLLAERNRLRERAVTLFEGLLARRRDPEGTLAATRQLLLLDSLHEQAWRAQINAYIAQDERGLALQSAVRCVAAFAERNGVEPGLETRRLLSELGQGPTVDEAGDAPPRGGAAPVPFTPPDAPPPSAAAHDEAPSLRTDRPSSIEPAKLRREPQDGQPLIAVLPLLDLNSDRNHAVLTHGLMENILVGLVQQSWLNLISGSELRDHLSQGRDDAMLRRSFGVDYVLDGTVQRAGGKTRVILRLTDIRQYGQIIWARRFDGFDSDVLDLQDRVTTTIVAQVPWEIMLIENRRLRHRPVAELGANGRALRSLGQIMSGDRLQSDRACMMLANEPAGELDDPMSTVMLALAHFLRCLQRWGKPQQEAALAVQAVRRAMERNPNHVGTVLMRSLIRSEIENEPEMALSLLERGHDPCPYLAAACSVFALVRLGRLDEAEGQFQRYKKLYPTHPFAMLLDQPAIMIPLLQGRYEEAVQVGAAASEHGPGFAPNIVPYLAALGHLRRAGEAERIRLRLETMMPADGVESLVRAAGLRCAKHSECLATGLRLAGLPERVDNVDRGLLTISAA